MLTIDKLHNYQLHCVEHIINNPACALFLDMGLGKTISTLTALQRLKYEEYAINKTLIVAPKRVAEYTWTDEIGKWAHLGGMTASKVLGNEAQRRRAMEAECDIYIINREMIPWLVSNYINAWPFDCVVIDELSSFKSSKSQRFKAMRLARNKTLRVIGLTGTPTPNGLVDLWAQMYIIDKGERLGRTITGYRKEFFVEGRRNAQIVFDYRPRPESEGRIRDRIKDICISMTKEDYLSLPECIVRDVSVRLSASEQQRYEDFEHSQVMQLLGQEITAVNAAALANKLSQYANGAIYDDHREVHEMHSAKLDALKEIVETSTSNILVAYAYKHDRDRIREALASYDPREIYSSEDLRAWNTGEIKVLIGHPASMGHGLNIQAGGSVIVWFGMTWSLELYMQFNARLHRQGQDQPVIIHRLITAQTIDERMASSLGEKKQTQDGIMDAVKAIIQKHKVR